MLVVSCLDVMVGMCVHTSSLYFVPSIDILFCFVRSHELFLPWVESRVF